MRLHGRAGTPQQAVGNQQLFGVRDNAAVVIGKADLPRERLIPERPGDHAFNDWLLEVGLWFEARNALVLGRRSQQQIVVRETSPQDGVKHTSELFSSNQRSTYLATLALATLAAPAILPQTARIG
jgi:hypothetical protein